MVLKRNQQHPTHSTDLDIKMRDLSSLSNIKLAKTNHLNKGDFLIIQILW